MGGTASRALEETSKRMKLKSEAMKLELEEAKKKMELEEAKAKMQLQDMKKKMELEDTKAKMQLEDSRKKVELDHSSRIKDLELRTEEMRTNYKLEISKSNMEHQHKIAELIAQMKQTNLEVGKELLLVYMETMNSIIQQNSTIHQNIILLSQQFSNDKLPDSIKEVTQEAIKKLVNAYKTPQELLDYTKQQTNELQLRRDNDFIRMLNLGIEKQLITQEDKIYILE